MITKSLDVSGFVSDENGAAYAVKLVKIDAASSGDNTVIAAVTGKKLRVLAVTLVAGGAVTVRWESGAAGTALTGQMILAASTVVSSPYSPHGHFETAAGVLLNLELSAAVTVDGYLSYIEV